MKAIVITGSSSGIGKATAKYFAAQGWRVAATMRKPENETELNQIEGVTLYQLDVTDDESIAKATSQILTDFDTVDVVLNNAGYALWGPFEKATWEQIKRQFETNVFGVMRVTRAFLPHFRANKAGLFMNVSSIGGRTTFPLFSLYHGTKWAIEGLSEALSYELSPFGIQVKIIEPGGVETDFGGRSLDIAARKDRADYDEVQRRLYANLTKSGIDSSTAEFQAEAIYAAATDGKSQLRYLIGRDAEQIYAKRQADGDENFIAGMKQRILS